jgi:F0F1-type ATP synthase membrane subunit b/b'
MASKIVEYRAEAARCEQRAKKALNQAEKEWQMMRVRAYLMLAEAEAERSTSIKNSSQY